MTKTDPDTLLGTVTFTFQSYDSDGNPELSWTIGAAPITDGTTTGGTATLSAPIPPGLVNPAAQYVDLIAEYSGDPHHLASTSAKSRVTFSALNFCVSPGVATVPAGAAFTFGASGGVGTPRWVIDADTTCSPSDFTGATCSTLDESTGAFKAGSGQAGWVLVDVYDGTGAETYAEITVGAPTGTTPWAGDSGVLVTGCPDSDAGGLPAADAATVVDAEPSSDTGTPVDAGTPTDATTPADTGSVADTAAPVEASTTADSAGDASAPAPDSSSGCGCTTAGSDRQAPTSLLAGLILAVGLVVHRRRVTAHRP